MEKTLFDISLILIVTKLLGIASRKMKMPEVLGALTAGVILGPIAFHTVEYSENIKLLSDLGVIFLMFLAGLETNFEEFKKAGKSSLVIAVMGVAVPLALGTASAFLFYSNPVENLFVGVILTATSVSITVETLTELGKLNSRVGVNILGAAVIDDVLGLILISVLLAVGGSAENRGADSSLFLTLIKVILFCTAAIFAVIYMPRIINKITQKFQAGRTMLTFSLAAALLAAVLAEKLGIAAITGAYLCGLVLSQFIHKDYLIKNVKAISSGFLSPIFFASVGLEANISGFSSKMVLILIVMLAVAVIGKIIGCGLAAGIFKMSRRESLQIGVGMVSRGEVAVITANIGLQSRIISQEIFIPTILVVILTTIITPILLKASFSHKTHHDLEHI